MLAPLVERTLPVQLPPHLAPSHQNRTTRILAPPGFAWGPLPPGGDANGGPYGRAHIEITKDPKDARALLIKRSVVFDQHLIPVEKYAVVARVHHAGRRAHAQGSPPRPVGR